MSVEVVLLWKKKTRKELGQKQSPQSLNDEFF